MKNLLGENLEEALSNFITKFSFKIAECDEIYRRNKSTFPILEDKFLAEVLGECEKFPHFIKMSVILSKLWPIILLGCYHHRYPVPLEFIDDLKKKIN